MANLGTVVLVHQGSNHIDKAEYWRVSVDVNSADLAHVVSFVVPPELVLCRMVRMWVRSVATINAVSTNAVGNYARYTIDRVVQPISEGMSREIRAFLSNGTTVAQWCTSFGPEPLVLRAGDLFSLSVPQVDAGGAPTGDLAVAVLFQVITKKGGM